VIPILSLTGRDRFAKRPHAIGLLALFCFLSGMPDLGAAERQIPDMLIGLETPKEGVAYAVAVEKETQQVSVFAFDGQYKLVERMDCSTGRNRGDKMETGDGRTPEGVYFSTQFHPDRDLAPLYGSGAYPLDYPHLLDRIAGRNGHSIWLHGTNKQLKSYDSNGCVALRNDDLQRLAAFVVINRTPVLIAERFRFVPPESQGAIAGALRRFISSWIDSQQTGSYQEYLAFYDADYIPEIAWWREWLTHRARLRNSGTVWRLELAHLSLLRQQDFYVALFDQILSTEGGEGQPAGTRKLFIQPRGEGFRICGEEYMGLPAQAPVPILAAMQRSAREEKATPAGAAAEPIKGQKVSPAAVTGQPEKSPATLLAAKKTPRQEVVEPPAGDTFAAFVDQWIKAWSSENIKAYAEFYAADFRSGQMGKQDYIAMKGQLNRKNAQIKVTRSDLAIADNGETATVSFLQRYESSSYRAVGVKRLILKQEKGKWKIYRETWSKR